jgi:hypothetical protein
MILEIHEEVGSNIDQAEIAIALQLGKLLGRDQ